LEDLQSLVSLTVWRDEGEMHRYYISTGVSAIMGHAIYLDAAEINYVVHEITDHDVPLIMTVSGLPKKERLEIFGCHELRRPEKYPVLRHLQDMPVARA